MIRVCSYRLKRGRGLGHGSGQKRGVFTVAVAHTCTGHIWHWHSHMHSPDTPLCTPQLNHTNSHSISIPQTFNQLSHDQTLHKHQTVKCFFFWVKSIHSPSLAVNCDMARVCFNDKLFESVIGLDSGPIQLIQNNWKLCSAGRRNPWKVGFESCTNQYYVVPLWSAALIHPDVAIIKYLSARNSLTIHEHISSTFVPLDPHWNDANSSWPSNFMNFMILIHFNTSILMNDSRLFINVRGRPEGWVAWRDSEGLWDVLVIDEMALTVIISCWCLPPSTVYRDLTTLTHCREGRLWQPL